MKTRTPYRQMPWLILAGIVVLFVSLFATIPANAKPPCRRQKNTACPVMAIPH